VQTDIKKVLAYSTVSQLGYMVMACGAGAFGAGVFHLMTHAFFKALLFLGAGSVIFALHHQQELWQMGGLRKKMPITHATFLIGVLAIIGFPGLSGFFSKDEILWRAFQAGGFGLWAVAVVTAVMTAFYMTRLLCLAFYGKFRGDHHAWDHCHENSPVIWIPLVVLAVFAAFAGYAGIPAVLGHVFHVPNFWEHFLEPVVRIPEVAHGHWAYLHEAGSPALEFGLMGTSVTLALVSAGAAVWLYAGEGFAVVERLKSRFAAVHRVLLGKYFVDEFYWAVFVRPLEAASGWVFRWVETLVIDGLVNGVANFFLFVAGVGSLSMSGSLHRHAMAIVVGFLCLLTVLMF
jgi:NADH-quinone oxidoreductase subunit L